MDNPCTHAWSSGFTPSHALSPGAFSRRYPPRYFLSVQWPMSQAADENGDYSLLIGSRRWAYTSLRMIIGMRMPSSPARRYGTTSWNLLCTRTKFPLLPDRCALALAITPGPNTALTHRDHEDCYARQPLPPRLSQIPLSTPGVR